MDVLLGVLCACVRACVCGCHLITQVSWWLALRPGLIPAFLHLLVLRSMFWQYVSRQYTEHAPYAQIELMDGVILETPLAEHKPDDDAASAGEEVDLGLLARAADMVLTKSLTQWLQGIQASIGTGGDALEGLYSCVRLVVCCPVW